MFLFPEIGLKKTNVFRACSLLCAAVLVSCSDSGTSAKGFDMSDICWDGGLPSNCGLPDSSSNFDAGAVCPESGRGTFVDERDGQEYKYTTIGNQVWMARNLNYAMPDTSLPDPVSGDLRGASTSCLYDDDCKEKGRLYTWTAAYHGCPAGWRLPSDEDWKTLLDKMGGKDKAGFRLKASLGWVVLNPGDDQKWLDECGFSALPTKTSDDPQNDSAYARWWSSDYVEGIGSVDNPPYYFSRFVSDGYYLFYSFSMYNSSLYSVRCIKD